MLAVDIYRVGRYIGGEYFVAWTRGLAQSTAIDGLYLKDPGGLLTVDRARSLIPPLQAGAGNLPFELHSHCTIGLAPFTYLEAAPLGAQALPVAVPPLGSGAFPPPAAGTIPQLRRQRHPVPLADETTRRRRGQLF